MNKKMIIVAIVVIAVWLSYLTIRQPSGTITERVINTVQNPLGGETGLSTECLGENEAGRTCWSVATGTIGATTTGTFLNTVVDSRGTGKTIILDKIEMYENSFPKASSTMIVWAATSSQATSTISDYDFPRISTTNNILANRGGGDSFPIGKIGVERYLVSSTTIATGTRPVVASFFGESSSWNPSDPTMRNVGTTTILGYLDRIVFGVAATQSNCGQAAGAGAAPLGTCGVATSTNDRGTIRWSVWYHYAQ